MMNSVDFLSCVFQLISDLKSARIDKLNEKENLYSVMMILEMDGEDDE